MGKLEKIILIALVAVPAIAIAVSAGYEAYTIGFALSIFSSVLAVAAVFSKQAKTATAFLVAGIIVAIVAAITAIAGILALNAIYNGYADGFVLYYLISGSWLLLPSTFAAGCALLVNIVALIGSTLGNLDIRK